MNIENYKRAKVLLESKDDAVYEMDRAKKLIGDVENAEDILSVKFVTDSGADVTFGELPKDMVKFFVNYIREYYLKEKIRIEEEFAAL